jgi:hypothetical protein
MGVTDPPFSCVLVSEGFWKGKALIGTMAI